MELKMENIPFSREVSAIHPLPEGRWVLAHQAKRYISWGDVVGYCDGIFWQMEDDHYKPEAIIGLLRGGIVPARLFSDHFHIKLDLFAMDVKFYTGIGETMEKPIIRSLYGDVKGKRTLIVDDIWDSGKTMKAVMNELKDEQIITTTLMLREGSKEQPDYCGAIAYNKEWIVFPWEIKEFE